MFDAITNINLGENNPPRKHKLLRGIFGLFKLILKPKVLIFLTVIVLAFIGLRAHVPPPSTEQLTEALYAALTTHIAPPLQPCVGPCLHKGLEVTVTFAIHVYNVLVALVAKV
jgi:hypothetical protein